MSVASLFSLLNIIAIIAIGIIGFRNQWLLVRETQKQWHWLKYGLSIICLAWSVLYTFVLLDTLHIGIPIDLQLTRSWLIRPMITITLALIASSGVARRKTNGTK
jgi:hypothetical protein